MPQTNGQRRLHGPLPADNVVATSAVLTAKRYTSATLVSALAGALAAIVPMGPAKQGTRLRGVEISFMGVGVDNDAGGFTIHQVKRGRVGEENPDDFELVPIYTGTFTLSTLMGAGSCAGTTERIADTITLAACTAATTPKGIGDVIESLYGPAAAVVYSPANNTPARLFIPDVGNGDILIELYRTAPTTSVNAVVEALT